MSVFSQRITPLRRETLQDGVFRRLCELILEGGMVPGQSVTVASLAEAFDVSPMPVREALARLTSMGVLTVVSGRTIGVPKLSRERLEDLRRVRVEVETTSARWAAERADAAFVTQLSAVLEQLDAAERSADPKSYVAANYDFHFALYRQAGSPILLGIIENLWLQISPYFHLLRESGNFRMSNRQHELIYQGVASCMPDDVVTALAADIDGAYDVLVRLI
ncbi:GntR family transcriptional regulator [Jiella sp. MQZ9-1]|uniref:GntR family transcriptional regulator n=1 Tax=Jiella flava TaxID=2816857 RepID=A0A939G0P7_9HYPH|nr:GntR family transcriptional regulator [Jiella flava]MBO0664216.1 GntR family transcriptional regulator [Jiella flava]MCD2472862.1 GntR family transcriptional regulator [Jiella flava]